MKILNSFKFLTHSYLYPNESQQSFTLGTLELNSNSYEGSTCTAVMKSFLYQQKKPIKLTKY
jgi:hypothetical protein